MLPDPDFVDGDVIISLPNCTFKVYKVLLVEKSSVFADLFSIARPSSPEPGKTDGDEASVEVVELHDEQKAFKLFLHILHDHGLDKYIVKLSRGTIGLISRTLDLFDKYEVERAPAYAKLVSFINRDWPDTLSAWDEDDEYLRKMFEELDYSVKEPQEVDEELPEPASVIRFAYMYAPSELSIQAIPSYLPVAFYHLSRLPPWADSDSLTLNGGDFWDIEGLRTAQRSLLKHRDVLCLLNGMDGLRLEVANIAFEGFLSVADSVESANSSEKAVMVNWWRSFGVKKLIGPHPMSDPLRYLKELVNILKDVDEGEENKLDLEIKSLREGTSASYRQQMALYLTGERQTIWDGLGYYFLLSTFFYN